MLKLNRLITVLVVCLSVGLQVSALNQVVVKGSKEADLLVDGDEEFSFKIDYSKVLVDAIAKRDKNNQLILKIGNCDILFWSDTCPADHKGLKIGDKYHMLMDYASDTYVPSYFHDDAVVVTVLRDKRIELRAYNAVHSWIYCKVKFEDSGYPGKSRVKVKLSDKNGGDDVDTNFVMTFYTAPYTPPTTTTLSTTTTSTTTTPKPTLPATVAILAPKCKKCEEKLEAWMIALIVILIILFILTIALCVIVSFCYKRMKKAKAKKAKMTEATTTVASQMGTVSNLKPIVKETNLNGPAMMYFARDNTPVDPSKSKVSHGKPTPQ